LEAYRSYAYSNLAFKTLAYSHSRIFDNPPVVHILEGVAGHLLLMGTTSAILIPVQKVKKTAQVCNRTFLCSAELQQHKTAPDHWLHSYRAQRICISAVCCEGLMTRLPEPKQRYLDQQVKNQSVLSP